MADTYPVGFDAIPDNADPDAAKNVAVGSMIGLMLMGAIVAAGGSVLAISGTVATSGAAVTTETTAVLTTEQLALQYGITEAEAMIYQSIVRAGGAAGQQSVKQALKFVADMAVKRFLQNGLSIDAAILASQAEQEAVLARASQIQSQIDAAILLAEARVNYQAALSLFFASGM